MIRFKKLKENAVVPKRGSDGAAGYDLCACVDDIVFVPPHKTVKVGTGLAIIPPTGTFGAIFPRSGLATKEGLRPANCVGVCDEDYRGEYIIAVHNDTDAIRMIKPGDRIAQLIFMPYVIDDDWQESELDDTARGTGGFGSTGKN